MRIAGFVFAALLGMTLVFAREGLAQGNSGCDGTVQSPVEGATPCNAYGLCRAFFAGSENGRAHKRNAPPFQALISLACGACEEGCECDGDGDCNDDEDSCVAMFCPDTNPGGHGKNPSDGSPGQAKRQ